VLIDPMDETPVSGLWAGACMENRTLPEAISGRYGDRRWVGWWDVSSPPLLDNGALRLAMASGDGSMAGRMVTSPCDGIGPGETIRARFKVRYACDVLYTDCDPQSPAYKQERRVYDVTSGYGGFKVASIGEIYPDNDVLDGGAGLGTPVLSHYKQLGFPAVYISGWNSNIEDRYMIDGVRYWDVQPGGADICYSYDNYAGCHMLQADEWMTFQMEITYGGCSTSPAEPYLSYFRLWIADEGEPFDLVVDNGMNIRCSGTAVTGLLGRISLDPFMTGKDPTEQHPVGYIWYEDVWVEIF
jgi:hypothetical protein